MIKYLWRRNVLKWYNDRRFYLPVVKRKEFSYLRNICHGRRCMKMWLFDMPEPFCELLNVSDHLGILYRECFEKNDFGEPALQKKMAENIRDLKMCRANFDAIVSRRWRELIEIEKDKHLIFRRPWDKVLDNAFKQVSFNNLEFREWALDASERVENAYISIRVLLSSKDPAEVAVYEDALYFATTRYKMVRHLQLRTILEV